MFELEWRLKSFGMEFVLLVAIFCFAVLIQAIPWISCSNKFTRVADRLFKLKGLIKLGFLGTILNIVIQRGPRGCQIYIQYQEVVLLVFLLIFNSFKPALNIGLAKLHISPFSVIYLKQPTMVYQIGSRGVGRRLSGLKQAKKWRQERGGEEGNEICLRPPTTPNSQGFNLQSFYSKCNTKQFGTFISFSLTTHDTL